MYARRIYAQSASPLLPPNTFKIAGIAFGIGVLLFGVFWMTGRSQGRATDTQVAPVAESTPTLPPLPAPLPAKGDVAANMPKAPSDPLPEDGLTTGNAPTNDTLPEPISSSPTGMTPVNMSAQMPTTAAPAPTTAATTPINQPTPLPGQMPPPEYPADAAARGDHGTVTVRVLVDAEGAPSGVEMAKSSGSRELDNAALQTVRGWRFKPARNSNDQPVPGSLEIPFEFNLGQ
ncbi:MAG TPA: energy transducer TonB [Xylella taiwanensis]